MSDPTPAVATADPAPLEARVALLEAFIARGIAGPAVRAAPPIVIGPFDNVPAPGSPIRSDWPQEITNYVVTNPQIQAGETTATTDAIGLGVFPFPRAFLAAPKVVANVKTSGVPGLIVTIVSVTTGNFSAQIIKHDSTIFVGAVTLTWIAFNPTG